MAWFEYYLLATFALGLVQLRHHLALYRLVLRTPGRWPKLYDVIKADLGELITWPTVLIVGLMWSAWLVHTLLRRMLWPSAAVSLEDFGAETWLFTIGVLTAAAMIVLDVRATFRVVRFRKPRMTWIIDLTELGLKSKVLPVRWYVQWRLRAKVVRSLPIVHRWMWKRTAEISTRLVFGATLWVTWYMQAP